MGNIKKKRNNSISAYPSIWIFNGDSWCFAKKQKYHCQYIGNSMLDFRLYTQWHFTGNWYTKEVKLVMYFNLCPFDSLLNFSYLLLYSWHGHFLSIHKIYLLNFYKKTRQYSFPEYCPVICKSKNKMFLSSRFFINDTKSGNLPYILFLRFLQQEPIWFPNTTNPFLPIAVTPHPLFDLVLRVYLHKASGNAASSMRYRVCMHDTF